MLKFLQILSCYALLLAMLLALSQGRPSTGETGSDVTDVLDTPDSDDLRNSYGYDLQAQAIYPNIPMDRLQMLIAQYRSPYSSYLRAPSYGNMNELYHLPETKRQVRYRQCYFNPISCFRK